MEAYGLDWAHLQDGDEDLVALLAAALAACARESRQECADRLRTMLENINAVATTRGYTTEFLEHADTLLTEAREAIESLERAVGEKAAK